MSEPVGIVGAGEFGQALEGTLRGRGVEVLAGLSVAETARRARFVVLAVRSARVAEVVEELGAVAEPDHIVVHALGALPAAAGGFRRVSELLRERTVARKIGAIAGPVLPADLRAGRPCGLVAASPYDEVVERARELLGAPPALRVYGSRELAGVELASALSGAMTVAIGLADGMGLGEGPRAAGITRAVAEMARIGAAYGVPERVFAGLAGLGNLLVRVSPDSREHSEDYRFGLALARGESGGAPTEGALAARAGAATARRFKVPAPLLTLIESVLDGAPVGPAVTAVLAHVPEEE